MPSARITILSASTSNEAVSYMKDAWSQVQRAQKELQNDPDRYRYTLQELGRARRSLETAIEIANREEHPKGTP